MTSEIIAEAPYAEQPLPGIVGLWQQFIYGAAPRKSKVFATAGALALGAGIVGRGYNVSKPGVGLNTYSICLQRTGGGKQAIADGADLILSACKATTFDAASINRIKGMGEWVSEPGFYNWIRENQCCVSFMGEIAKKLKQMANPNSHLNGLSRALLQMYTKSGRGKVFDPSAYSEKVKNGQPIESPAYSFIGDGTEAFYENLTDDLVSDGLIPRLMVFEDSGAIAKYDKKSIQDIPSKELVSATLNLIAHCRGVLESRGEVCNVPFTARAEQLFDELEDFALVIMNGKSSAVARDLWSRAAVKAMKIAAIVAVGNNYISPQIDEAIAMWAIELIRTQTNHLIGKFERGETGIVEGDQNKQLDFAITALRELFSTPWNELPPTYKKQLNPAMHFLGYFPNNYLQTRCRQKACFKGDKRGIIDAYNKIILAMIKNNDIGETNFEQTKLCQNNSKCYGIKNFETFGLPVPDISKPPTEAALIFAMRK